MLIEHMRNLHSFESFSADIGVHKETLYEWCKVHKEFSEARKKGRMTLLKGMENVGKGLFTGKIKGNVAAWIFYMKNTTEWRDDPSMSDDAIEGVEFVDE
jgi:hypothetical protein